MTDTDRLEAIRRLLQLADAYGLAELEVEEAGLTIRIRGADAAPAVGAARPPGGDPAGAGSPEEQPRYHAILSPMTGVFYRSGSPEAPPFVEPGDRVEENQAIGLIEAMKVFSEIPADRSGRIVEILTPNGQLVSQDDPLMLLDPED